MKQVWGVAALVVALVVAHDARAETVNRIVATIDGEPVTQFELETYYADLRARANGADVPADQRAALDELVLDKIMQKQVAEQGLRATDQQVDAYIQSIREKNGLSEDGLREALKQQGMTWDGYRARVRADIERANLINKEIRAKVNVSPEEVERFYKANLDQYGKAESVNVRMISFLYPEDATAEQKAELEQQAKAVREQAADGADFGELAKKHSQGPGAADGGDLGELTRGQMQKEFEDAAFALKPGKVSDVIATDTGLHILKVEAQAGASHRPLDEVSDAIKEQLYRQAMEDRYDRWLKQDLRARHHVEILL